MTCYHPYALVVIQTNLRYGLNCAMLQSSRLQLTKHSKLSLSKHVYLSTIINTNPARPKFANRMSHDSKTEKSSIFHKHKTPLHTRDRRMPRQQIENQHFYLLAQTITDPRKARPSKAPFPARKNRARRRAISHAAETDPSEMREPGLSIFSLPRDSPGRRRRALSRAPSVVVRPRACNVLLHGINVIICSARCAHMGAGSRTR